MDLDKTIPLAESVITIEENGKPGLANSNCLNCESVLTGPFCSQCGQKNLARRQTLGELLINFISSFWSYESKFFRTWHFLLFKPGKLSAEYNLGKREKYFHPARMYVFISFVFFLLIAALPEDDDNNHNNLNIKTREDLEKEGIPMNEGSMNFFKGDYKTYDSIQNALPAEKRDGTIKHWIKKKTFALEQRYKDKPEEFKSSFASGYQENIPRVFFCLLPLFALLLKLLYIRRDYFYSEHLVFSIYYYNFFFLAGSIFLLVDLIPIIGDFSSLIILWIIFYLLFAMKRMYMQSWGKTLFKFCTFVFIFSFLIGIGLLVNLALTLIFI